MTFPWSASEFFIDSSTKVAELWYYVGHKFQVSDILFHSMFVFFFTSSLTLCLFPYSITPYSLTTVRIPKRDRASVNVLYIFWTIRTWLNLEVWKIKADHFFCVTNSVEMSVEQNIFSGLQLGHPLPSVRKKEGNVPFRSSTKTGR